MPNTEQSSEEEGEREKEGEKEAITFVIEAGESERA